MAAASTFGLRHRFEFYVTDPLGSTLDPAPDSPPARPARAAIYVDPQSVATAEALVSPHVGSAGEVLDNGGLGRVTHLPRADGADLVNLPEVLLGCD